MLRKARATSRRSSRSLAESSLCQSLMVTELIFLSLFQGLPARRPQKLHGNNCWICERTSNEGNLVAATTHVRKEGVVEDSRGRVAYIEKNAEERPVLRIGIHAAAQ